MVETLRFSARASMLAMLTAASFAAAAAESAPNEAQAAAIRQSCRADYEKVCAGVPTGGEPALQCLKQNILRVSQPCQSALAAIGPGAANLPRPTTLASAQQQITKAAGQPPKPATAAPPPKSAAGAPSSAGTASTTKAAGATVTASAAGTTAAAKAAPDPATLPPRLPENGAPSKVPFREEVTIARDACGPEYRKFCQMVRPGGGRAIACLEQNDASLTPACKKVVAEARQRM